MEETIWQRNLIKVGQRKKPQLIISQDEEQDELYFQNFQEQQYHEESVCYGFKRMMITDEADETQKIGKKIIKNKQQIEDLCFQYQVIHQKTQNSRQNTQQKHDNNKQKENQETLIINYNSEDNQECCNVVQIEEINYINSLNRQQEEKVQTKKFKAKKLKKPNLNHFLIKDKVISKR